VKGNDDGNVETDDENDDIWKELNDDHMKDRIWKVEDEDSSGNPPEDQMMGKKDGKVVWELDLDCGEILCKDRL
jgi:hypothetical protein